MSYPSRSLHKGLFIRNKFKIVQGTYKKVERKKMSHAITKDFKKCIFATLIDRVAGMPGPKTAATHYHAQFGLLGKGRAIKYHG